MYIWDLQRKHQFFKAESRCGTGTHVVKYTPNIRGSYQIDVRIPSVNEVQRIRSAVSPGSSLSGSFALVEINHITTHSTPAIIFDASANDVKVGLEVLPLLKLVNVDS